MKRINALILGLVLATLSPLAGAAVDIAQKPVFLNPPDPRMMLVMSRDHQLSMKAYNDYSDLNGDGVLDTSYTDTVEYYGYFNPKRCYSYTSGSGGRFEPAGTAGGLNSHECSSQWSGNFLNWAAMTRMDVLRKVLYGGYRSTDNNGTALGDTVLERAMLPNDVHAFAKIFAPAGGATDVAKFTPYSYSSISICNVTPATSGQSNSTTVAPALQVASGSWTNWAFYDGQQCGAGSGAVGDKPSSGSITTLTARVAVCVSGKEEDNCTTYGSNKKPTGLLQKYGESTAAARVRFGLLTGSYSKNKSGGVLRKNTTWMSGNTTATDNEINTATGQFINQGASDYGIVNTINRFRIAGWDFGTHKYQYNCGTPGILTFNNGECVDWGNPLSEMYLESLRYFAGNTSPSNAFDTSDASIIPNLPKVTWSDPLPSTEWCALSNTIVLSTGLGSFDDDDFSSASDVPGLNPAVLTTAVGTKEGISGSYLIGDNSVTSDNQCTGKTLADLKNAKGICPEGPSLKGTYFIAGLAYSNQTVDLRPLYKADRTNRWGDPSKGNYKPDYAARQPMGTYTVALAESLPKLEIPVSGGTISFLPACQANSDPNATASTSGWRVCSLTDMKVLSLNMSGGNIVSGQLEMSWEDSTWGNDYDLDGKELIDFCVGTACSPAVSSNEFKITAQTNYAQAGHTLRFGYTVTGSDADGTYLDILRPGGQNFTSIATRPGTVTGPTYRTFDLGSSAAKLLENPLWYAAKYGSADYLSGNWDVKNNKTGAAGADGVPDNYFKVTNPAGLYDALGKVFEAAATADASASAIATNSTRLDTNTHVYQALFHTPGWYGELKAIPLSSTGAPGTPSWDASDSTNIPAAASRKIATWDGSAWNAGAGSDFLWGAITSTQKNAIDSANASNGSSPVLDYIRGDQSNEANGTYRKRSTLLGDIVNSDPHYVAVESYGYDQPGSGLSATEQAAYTTFRTTFKAGRKPALYVGSNDGMLHAINASDTAAGGGGQELFTYVPNAVIPNLKNLASPTYQHQYFVDGSPNSGDAYLGAAWKTVLLGTLGAGGKAVFALDITDPDAFDASKVMWEFTDTNDLGNIMGHAFVARMNDGNWYAVFGNGYNSANQHALLYMVPLDKSLGLPVIKIDTGVGTDNGLSEPALLDTTGDRIVDAIYAGDLKGNVWKFDVSGATTGSWKVAYKTGSTPSPLFQAMIGTTAQPITSPLEIGAAPSGQSGYMIYFGTGKYLGNSDIGPTNTQTGYGILDSGSKITNGRSDLQGQSFVYEGPYSATNSDVVRVVSTTAFSYSGGSAKKGWYLDLLSPNTPTNLGERIVSVPLLRYGRVIFTSIVPSAAVCDQGGYSWLTEVDAFTGAGLPYSVFNFNGDTVFDSSDYVSYTSGGSTVNAAVSGKKLASEGLLKSPTVISAGEKEYKVGSGTAGGIVVVEEKGTTGVPRTSWRQLFPQ
ncbi:pilus assembly protein [Thiobacillus thioparus]|uniref:pilus assembly protein n=1 Tax=Thiobacillus thioparus TaxID=931 RepID=UPI0003AAE32A|nr:PilC/PilY family type IV pilus protein [Thiobacillus thioparus]